MGIWEEASSLKLFLLDITRTDYTEEECKFIIENRLLDKCVFVAKR